MNCQSTDDALLVASYVAGQDLTVAVRRKLFANWDAVDCQAWTIIGASGRPSSERARALRLLLLAITNRGDGYWQPASRPKKVRREFSRQPPYLRAEDYQTICDLALDDDSVLRDEARNFMRSVPVDQFDRLFRTASAHPQASAEATERLAIAASQFYYNRIVEFLSEAPPGADGTPTEARERANKIIAENLNLGLGWASNARFVGKNASAYQAMLYYAVAIVEYEKSLRPDRGKASFAAMLTQVRASTQPYPTNPRHVGQALAIAEGGAQSDAILPRVNTADTVWGALQQDTPLKAGDRVDLHVGPGPQFAKQASSFELKGAIRVLLRSGEWDLIQSTGAVGWILRPSG